MGDVSNSSHVMQQIKNRKNSFLAAFSECGNITKAAEIAGLDRSRHYDWLKNDPEYAERFKDAEEQATERLESEARRRAVQGVEKPVFYQGQVCGTVTEYSDTLLMFLLKGIRPEKYKDRVSNEVAVASPIKKEDGVATLRDLQQKRLKETEGIEE